MAQTISTDNIPRVTNTTPMVTPIPPPGTTINPTHEIIPRTTGQINPRGYTTTPPTYPVQEVVVPATVANVNAINPLSSGLVVPAPLPVVAPLKAKTVNPIPAGRYLRNRRGDLLASSEDTTMMDHVRATHDVDAVHYKVKPLLHLIEDIMPRANAAIPGHVQTILTQPARLDAILEEKVLHSGLSEVVEALAYPVHRTSSEMICGYSNQIDAHNITLSVLKLLANYWWDAKAVITFAAFAEQYGEFGLVVRLYPTDPLAKSVATIKQIPDIMESAESLGAVNSKFREVTKLVSKMVEVTNQIVALKEIATEEKLLKVKYRVNVYKELAESLSPVTAEQENVIAKASYYVVKAAVTCSLVIFNLLAVGRDYYSSTEEDLEISTLTHKLSYILGDLQKATHIANQEIGKIKHTIKRKILEETLARTHTDNKYSAELITCGENDPTPIIHGAGIDIRKHGLEMLRRKYVFLLVSDLDIPNEVITMLRHMYLESKQDPSRLESQFEIVWLPIVDRRAPWTEAKEEQFKLVKDSMPWYSVSHPSKIDEAVYGYVKEVWGFTHKPLLAVVDPQGKLININALPMFWIWGSVAFPFNKLKEESLWSETSWSMALLADSIDQNLFTWLNDGKYICLYGGEDMDWIRTFTKTARYVAQQARIPLEMLYVGKMNVKDRIIKRNNATIQAEGLSSILQDPTMIWFFWERLESMWFLKGEKTPAMQDNDTRTYIIPEESRDPILQQVKAILSYDGSNRGWAVFSRGLAEMTKGEGSNVVKVLNNFDSWRHEVTDENAFIPALDKQLRGLYTKHHCTRMVVPAAVGHYPETVACVECGRSMEKFFMYSCCLDEYET
ncbi:PREDICTED: protein SIEVE ELEMENT OCCLUSION B-like [Ipomoea nil]|uniref:protein SIEVE ELEMENT OCCLUSION B-like n=1 Tax=Ipomoea nil TaxID=35883 RepID=UPI000901EEBB|nr:PREDICTED: protein SIEVE ELEMENT OCCLUSION B-like [Ipomoea nil]